MMPAPAAFFAALLCAVLIPGAAGHGIGYEVLPPMPLGDRMVELEIVSSQYENLGNPDREIQFSLRDAGDESPVEDVTYRVVATKAGGFLFDQTLAAADGVFVFVLEGGESDEVSLEKRGQGGWFESIAGLKKEVIYASGAAFQTGGLYKFKVDISSAAGPPIAYDVGLSVPDTVSFDIRDPNFGVQRINLTSYYDEVSDFAYDPDSRGVSFSMPFEWDIGNINETSVVHEEVAFPKTFGDVLVARYDTHVNGIKMPERVTVIDDFSEGRRTVHMVLNQNDLRGILDGQERDVMDFLLVPKDGSPFILVTENGQFRITVSRDPGGSESGTETFLFDITDVFLKNTPVAVSYEVFLEHDGRVVAGTGGTSDDSGRHNEFGAPVGADSGVMVLRFENLDGNALARAELPIVVGSDHVTIPDWFRDNAGWWSGGRISDSDFIASMEYVTGMRITGTAIPDWFRDSAAGWSDMEISGGDFAAGVRRLMAEGTL